MKIIPTGGMGSMQELEGSGGWYWCCDYASGDLYEAEELYRHNHPIRHNRLLLIHYPDGRVVEPLVAQDGQYLGAPAFADGNVQLLLVDFPAAMIRVFQFDGSDTRVRAEIPLTEVPDCYNLMFGHAPLMVLRHGSENSFQCVWPEKTAFPIGNTESFDSREGDKLYFSRWFEDPDYRDEVVIRRWPDGEILEVIPGALWEMPDGQRWVLQ